MGVGCCAGRPGTAGPPLSPSSLRRSAVAGLLAGLVAMLTPGEGDPPSTVPAPVSTVSKPVDWPNVPPRRGARQAVFEPPKGATAFARAVPADGPHRSTEMSTPSRLHGTATRKCWVATEHQKHRRRRFRPATGVCRDQPRGASPSPGWRPAVGEHSGQSGASPKTGHRTRAAADRSGVVDFVAPGRPRASPRSTGTPGAVRNGREGGRGPFQAKDPPLEGNRRGEPLHAVGPDKFGPSLGFRSNGGGELIHGFTSSRGWTPALPGTGPSSFYQVQSQRKGAASGRRAGRAAANRRAPSSSPTREPARRTTPPTTGGKTRWVAAVPPTSASSTRSHRTGRPQLAAVDRRPGSTAGPAGWEGGLVFQNRQGPSATLLPRRPPSGGWGRNEAYSAQVLQ